MSAANDYIDLLQQLGSDWQISGDSDYYLENLVPALLTHNAPKAYQMHYDSKGKVYSIQIGLTLSDESIPHVEVKLFSDLASNSTHVQTLLTTSLNETTCKKIKKLTGAITANHQRINPSFKEYYIVADDELYFDEYDGSNKVTYYNDEANEYIDIPTHSVLV